jgi:hypothetical protein
MPIEKNTLAGIARAYVKPMTSIRGRRIHRLLLREFSRFDYVIPAIAEDRSPALLAIANDGSVAVCRTDGRGAAVAIAGWSRLEGATVTTSYDLTKDSLPIVSWVIWHSSFATVAGALTIPVANSLAADPSGVSDILRRMGSS